MAIRFGLGERSISDACFSVSSARTWFLFGDLVGRCGIMRHIDVLTCRINTLEWLFSSELGDRAVIFSFFLFFCIALVPMADYDGAFARNYAVLGRWLRESLAA